VNGSAQRSANLVNLGLVTLIAALIGLNYSVMKAALEDTTPLVLAALRTSVGGPVLLAFAFARGERLPKTKAQWLAIWWISLTITTVSSGALVIGVSKLSAGLTGMLSATMPLFTAVFAVWLLRERPGRIGAAGVLIGFVGALVLAWPAFSAGNTAIGVFWVMVAASTWAIGGVLNKLQPAALEVAPVMLVAVQIMMSCICLHMAALVFEDWGDTTFSLDFFWLLVYAGIPSLALSFLLFTTVLRRAPAIVASVSAYLTPLFGVFFGWLIRDERFGLVEIVGGALIIAGIGVLTFSRMRAAPAPPLVPLGPHNDA
jgi:probable blue pigment (indigoidine) exporter